MKDLKIQLTIVIFLTLLSLDSFSQESIIIDGKGTGRIFDGITGVNAGGGVGRLLMSYPEPQRSEILDYLFRPNFGASIQGYKAEIGGDGNSTEGSEPSHMHTADDQNYTRGYQWWMMKEAKKRNPNIKLMALAWDFPAWIKDVCSQSAADYLVNYIKGAKKIQNLDIEYMGLWNETKTCKEFPIILRKALNANGLKNVKIIADDIPWDWSIAEKMKANKELYDAVDIVCTHYPKYESTQTAKEIGKPIWSTEDGPWIDGWAMSGQVSGPWAKVLNQNYILGKMTSTHAWNIITAYYDVLELPNAGLMRAKTPWSGFYEVMSPIWSIAHTTQFAQPGWQYIDQACGVLKNGGSFVTLKSGKNYSTIIETHDATEKQTINFTVANGLSTGKVFVWRTDSASYFEKIAEIVPEKGTYSLTVNKNSIYSITTTTGQHKGTTVIPKEKPFPVPYKDDFEQYEIGNTAVHYFSEQNGAYEIVASGFGRKGKAMRQVVNQIPIAWGSGATSHLLGTASIIGDEKWNNYSVSCDVLLEESGYARVMGRVSRATLDGQINGYQLYLFDNGNWKMKYATTMASLDSGKMEGGLKKWHQLKMTFNGNLITSFIDDKKISEVTDTRFVAGMAGIGNNYNKGLYDNFEINLVKGAELYAKEMGDKGYYFEKIPDSPSMHNCLSVKTAVKLSWDAVMGAKGYRVKYGTEEGKLNSVAEIGNLTAYTIWTLKSGQKYYFQVVAYNDKGESTPSRIESGVAK